MANEMIASIPVTVPRLNGLLNGEKDLVLSGVLPMKRMPKSDTQGFVFNGALPEVGTLAGMKLIFPVTDDGTDPDDLGKVVRFGFTVKRIVSGTDNGTLTDAATEVTADVTLGATSGELVLASLATASIDSTVEGDSFLIRVRRIGTASQDTCRGAVLIGTVSIINAAS